MRLGNQSRFAAAGACVARDWREDEPATIPQGGRRPGRHLGTITATDRAADSGGHSPFPPPVAVIPPAAGASNGLSGRSASWWWGDCSLTAAAARAI